MIFFLSMTAAVAIAHTLLGPDHYLPFIALSKARGWSWRRTFWITFACGLGHIVSAVLLGCLTLRLGFSLEKLNWIESARGSWTGWALIVFGLIYLTWGLRLAFKTNVAVTSPQQTGILPWVLFIIFVLGPCEPLIPIMMCPVWQQNIPLAFGAAGLFAAATLVTMLAVVTVSYQGLHVFALGRWGRFSNAIAGLVIALCGLGIRFGGL